MTTPPNNKNPIIITENNQQPLQQLNVLFSKLNNNIIQDLNPNSLSTHLQLLTIKINDLKKELTTITTSSPSHLVNTDHTSQQISTLQKQAITISQNLIIPNTSLKSKNILSILNKIQHEDRAKSIQILTSFIETMITIQETLNQFDNDVDHFNFSGGVKQLNILNTSLEELKTHFPERDTLLLREIIRDEISTRQQQLETTLIQLVQEGFKYTTNANSTTLQIQIVKSSSLTFDSILCLLLQQLYPTNNNKIKNILTTILTPLREEYLPSIIQGYSVVELKSNHLIITQQQQQQSLIPIQQRFIYVQHVLQFISDIICNHNESLLLLACEILLADNNSLSNLCLNALESSLTTTTITNSTTTTTTDFNTIIREFELKLIEYDYPPIMIQTLCRPLTNWVAHVQDHTCQKLQTDILTSVRQELLKTNQLTHDTVIVTDSASGISIRVSKAASLCYQLGKNAMDEASKSQSIKRAQVLFETSHDCFHLFRMISPILRKKNDRNTTAITTTNILAHNDFWYLGRELTYLAIQSSSFPLKSQINTTTTTTIHLAELFLNEATQMFDDEIHSKQVEISNLAFSSKLNDALLKIDEVMECWNEYLVVGGGGGNTNNNNNAVISIEETIELIRTILCDGFIEGCISSLCLGKMDNNNHHTTAKKTMKDHIRVMIQGITKRTSHKSSTHVGIKKLQTIDNILEPHVSFPIFQDIVNEELLKLGMKPIEIIGLARMLFSQTCTKQELEEFEKKLMV
jgi:hypothetical protein